MTATSCNWKHSIATPEIADYTIAAEILFCFATVV
jgi:hypothetical protein